MKKLVSLTLALALVLSLGICASASELGGSHDVTAKYEKSVAQVCLRWCLQHNVLAIPKTVNPERLAQNLDLFGFEITDDDMARIDAMPEYGYSGIDPEVFG